MGRGRQGGGGKAEEQGAQLGKIFNYLYVYECLPTYRYVYHTCAWALGARKGSWVSWNWSYICL